MPGKFGKSLGHRGGSRFTFNVSYAGVTLGLIHGSQPDALVVCHEAGRPHMRSMPHFPLIDLPTCIDVNLQAARLTNPDVRCVGAAINTSRFPKKRVGWSAIKYLKRLVCPRSIRCETV